jgi:RNA polymerase-binding transcription factor DksA
MKPQSEVAKNIQMLIKKRTECEDELIELKQKAKLQLSEHTDALKSHEAETNTRPNIIFVRINNKEKMIEKINESIKKASEGMYGVCKDCGEKIDPDRLTAVPFADRCTVCKEQTEKKNTISRSGTPFRIDRHMAISV